ncbi:levodione reductase domain protein [Cooperia oncophora]
MYCLANPRGRFEGKVAIVTGSSNGIGRATAVLFAEEGAKVTITGRDAEALATTKKEMLSVGAKNEDIVAIQGDLIDESVQKKLIDATLESFGKIDILS